MVNNMPAIHLIKQPIKNAYKSIDFPELYFPYNKDTAILIGKTKIPISVQVSFGNPNLRSFKYPTSIVANPNL